MLPVLLSVWQADVFRFSLALIGTLGAE